jgi:replicative DNA helicase
MKYSLNEDTQRAILFTLCDKNPFCAKWISLLEPQFFKTESEARSRILEIIKEYHEKKKKSPGFSVVQQELQFLPKNIRGIVEAEWEEIEEVEHDYSIDQLDDVVNEFILNRSILSAMEKQLDLVKSRDYDSVGVPLQRALRTRLVDTGMDFFEQAQQTVIEDSVVFQDRLPLIFPTVNKYAYGGWGRTEMWTIMGQEFKSQFLLHLAFSGMLNGEDGCYVSFELAKEVVLHRVTCMMTGCSLEQSIGREKWVLDRIKRVRAFMTGDMTVLKYPMNTMTVDGLRNRVATKEAERGKPFDWLLIDYPGLMLPSKGKEGNQLALGQITGDIKCWADEEEKRVAIAAQLTREGQASTQRGRNHVSQDKSIIDNSDSALSLNMTAEEYKSGLMNVFIMKMRNGIPYKTVPMTWGEKSFRFKETEW